MKFPVLLGVVVLLVAVAATTLPWTDDAAKDAAALPLSPVERGHQLAAARGCIACHSLDGAPGIGPSWQGSYGALRSFTDGSFTTVDDDYLRDSIHTPAARVVTGYQNVMLPAALTAAQTDDIIALIRDLTVTKSP